jgi:hypothetical protein
VLPRRHRAKAGLVDRLFAGAFQKAQNANFAVCPLTFRASRSI